MNPETTTRESLPYTILPSSNYLAVCSVPSARIRPEMHQNQLLILDLNGPLCQRTKKGGFTLRPHAQSFFDFIFHHFLVMVWSSATAGAVDNMCNMFGSHQPAYVWNRNHFANLTKAERANGVLEIAKDLTQVWNTLPLYNATNTIVIDDNAAKLPAQPHNLVRINTFNAQAFNHERFMDRDLVKAANYLRLVRKQSNVCNFMQRTPFDVELDWETHENHLHDRRVGIYRRGQPTVSYDYYAPSTTIPLQDTTIERHLIRAIKARATVQAQSSSSYIQPQVYSNQAQSSSSSVQPQLSSPSDQAQPTERITMERAARLRAIQEVQALSKRILAEAGRARKAQKAAEAEAANESPPAPSIPDTEIPRSDDPIEDFFLQALYHYRLTHPDPICTRVEGISQINFEASPVSLVQYDQGQQSVLNTAPPPPHDRVAATEGFIEMDQNRMSNLPNDTGNMMDWNSASSASVRPQSMNGGPSASMIPTTRLTTEDETQANKFDNQMIKRKRMERKERLQLQQENAMNDASMSEKILTAKDN